jgi:hypothetical protein
MIEGAEVKLHVGLMDLQYKTVFFEIDMKLPSQTRSEE